MKTFFYKYGLIAFLIISVSQLGVGQTFFGTTRAGGTTGGGTIFRVNADGSGLTTDYNFQVDANPGRGPDYAQMVLVNGLLYGVMPNGGKNDTGLLFSYNPIDNTYTKKIDFDDQVLTGWGPIGTLCLANGKLYGTTKEGGTKYNGTIFQYDPTNNTFTKKVDFDKTISGSTPLGGLTSATNGKFYGMTIGGGANDKGVLFEYDGASTITKKIDFDGLLKGSLPLRNLKEFGGKLYGMTVAGGINDKGVLFEFDPAGAGTFTKKFDFDGSANGSGPVGSLLLAANGKFYGTTIAGGGVSDKGTLFEYTPGGTTITTKVVFDGVAKGAKPGPELVQLANGKIYGTTEVGGTLDIGVLFEYDPSSSAFTKMIDFEYVTKGNIPKGGLVLANNKLYGTTAFGGAYDGGTLFEFVPSPAAFTKKIDFNQSTNGIKPENSLVALPNGKLYGLTPDGATNGQGVIFEYDPITKVYTKKFEFSDWLITGANPYGSLVLANNGKLYGMTQGGGLNNVGVLFEYDILNATYTKKFEFGSNNGANPYGGLMLSSNGNLYGMTTFGGQNNKGILFEYVPGATTITKKIDFAGTNGSLPHGNLMIASNGKFYGMTEQGGTGTNNMGVLFEYDLGTNTLTNKVDFLGSTNGRAPICNLIQAANGKLYGVTQYGGANDNGVIFEFDPVGSGSFTKKIDFDSNGKTPWGSLSVGANGKLIGLTGNGGINNLGAVFEYDPIANTVTKKNEFTGTNGAFPGFGSMASIIFPPTISTVVPSSGPIGTTVTITGTYFSATAANNIVYFGATKAVVISATTIQLTVTVPVGATYEPISVLTNGLLAYSSKPFVVTFNGATGIDANSFAAKTDFTTGTAPYSVSIGDLDGDGKADLAVANRGSNTVSVFRNTGSSGSVNYGAKVDFITGTGPISVSIGDLDGDGKADLAVANEANGTGNTVSVFRNTGSSGSISYADKVDFITGTAPRTVSIGDLDGDGRADLAVANDGSGTVSIFRNTGSLGSINYDTKVDFVTGARALSVAIGDIDGDGKADLAVANYGSGTVSVFRNTSNAGSISYAAKVDFTTGGGPHSVSIGDLDEDGKADLALANYGGVGSTISVFRNTGSVGSISYAAKVDFTSGTLSTSISIGNLDGDGKSDLVVANYGSNTISVFRNTGSVGSISYAAKVDFTTQGPIIASIGDLDGDGKADLAVTNDSGNTVSVFRNTVLSAPTITSFTPTSGAVSTSVTINGTNFSTTAINNTVKFNGTTATITGTPTATAIVTSVPANATTGKITVDVSGQIATNLTDFIVTIASTTIQITNEAFLTTYDKGSTLTVSVTLNDANNVSAVNFKSRGISEDVTAIKSVEVTAVGKKYEKVVAAADLKDELGLVYSFEVVDNATPAGVVNSTTGKAYVKHPVSSTGQILPYSTFGNKLSNYQIIAVPLELTDKKVPNVFAALMPYAKPKWRLFEYASNDNREFGASGAFTTIDAGKGYWLIVKDNTTINLGEGKAVMADDVTPFQITLASGWNLIGNPYNFNVLWSDVLAANPTVTGVEATLTTFSGGTLTPLATVLQKYRGAFVKSNNINAVTLKIPVKYNSAAGRVAQTVDLLNTIDQTNWEVKLALEQDGLRSEMGGIGMNLKATLKGKDEFDKEHVPLPFDIAEISSPHPEVSSFFNKDIVPTQENFTWQFDVNRSAEEGDIELSWANHYFGDSEKQLILFDPATLQVVDMRLVNRFTISERTKKIRILFGDNDYIQQALDKELPWLGSAYPNPAKEELTIPFRVTENQDNMMVQIKIYNSHGVEIATPIQQTLPKGNYDVKWQPKGETGLYIIRMTIGQQETKAMKVIIN